MTWLATSWLQVLALLGSHLLLVLPAITITALVAIPLGRLADALPRTGGALLSAASLLYAIPALPLLIMIPVVLGTPLRSPATMIAALTLYGVALLVRTAADAFSAVDPAVRQAAIAVGHSAPALFWRVDLPLATPILVSGMRVVTVSTVGLVTIGALVGIPGLGTLFTDGFQRGITAEVVTGIVLTVVLALALDRLCLLAGRAATPWERAAARPRSTTAPVAEVTA